MAILTSKTMRLMLVLSAVLLMALSASSAFGQGKPATIDVIIGFNSAPGASANALIDGVGGTVNGRFSIISAVTATIPVSALNGLQSNPNVAYVEEDGFKDLHTDSSVGELQWGVNRIDAEAVWASNTGTGVRVADLDTGIDADHPDLAANVEETWSVAGRRADAANPGTDADDKNGHGTATAGVIGAVRNSGGTVGVAPDVDIIAIQISKNSRLRLSDIVDGIELAIIRNADVMNMSFGGGFSQAEADAITAASNAGIVMVASAGNSSGGSVGYPAALPEVIAVSASTISDGLASFSSVGSQVELIAPGANIYTTYKDGTYVHINGTSFSAPQVTGVAALLLGAGVSSANVRARLTGTAEDLGLSANQQGSGLVDAEKAVLGSTAGDNLPGGPGPDPTPTPAPDPTPTPVPGDGSVYHSSDIDSVAPKKGPWYQLAATITVRDADDNLAPEGATVTGRITRDGRTFNYTQTVDANGQVQFKLRTQLVGTIYTVVVDSVDDDGGSTFDGIECASRTVTIGAGQGTCQPGASHS